MLPLIGLIVIVALFAKCGGESPPAAPRRRPEHPEDGTPPFEEDPPDDTGVTQAEEALGTSFDLYVDARREGRAGCGLIRVQDIEYTPNADGQTVSIFAEGRWAAFRGPLSGSDQVASEVAYRSGDFPISWFTEEYPQHGTLGLKYLVTGELDLASNRLTLTLDNFDAEAGGVTGLFLTPVYEPLDGAGGDDEACAPDESFSNEFFIAVPALETAMIPEGESRTGLLCGPCEPPVDEVALEIRE